MVKPRSITRFGPRQEVHLCELALSSCQVNDFIHVSRRRVNGYCLGEVFLGRRDVPVQDCDSPEPTVRGCGNRVLSQAVILNARRSSGGKG